MPDIFISITVITKSPKHASAHLSCLKHTICSKSTSLIRYVRPALQYATAMPRDPRLTTSHPHKQPIAPTRRPHPTRPIAQVMSLFFLLRTGGLYNTIITHLSVETALTTTIEELPHPSRYGEGRMGCLVHSLKLFRCYDSLEYLSSITSRPSVRLWFFSRNVQPSLTTLSTLNETNPVKLNGVEFPLDLKHLAAFWHVTPPYCPIPFGVPAFFFSAFPSFYDLVTFLYVLWLSAVPSHYHSPVSVKALRQL